MNGYSNARGNGTKILFKCSNGVVVEHSLRFRFLGI